MYGALPYVSLTSLDARSARTAPALRHIARTPDATRTVILSTPHPTTDPHRFMAEADASRYLLGSWVLPAVELAGPGQGAWHASPYVPVLPLPTALGVLGGPLPERTVRALAVALAETLSVIHGQSLTHAGVSPAAVLLAHDGPRLTGFGAVRAAAPDGVERRGLVGVDASVLAPEQASGGMPRPLGDVYALGATLAYAATGSTMPERDELPSWLRPTVARCLSRDPAQRPQLAEVVQELAPGPGHGGDAGFGVPEQAAALLGPGWLPARLIAALAHQAAAVLRAETPATAHVLTR
ncbi:protein kinase family protein [Streptomyces xanthii]|uniref:Serine/threonine protein kinase n=1 Tax=Streptomyces xanthii TaxID=2768069 RepID=A0A7H1B4V4_9ACTN|nr:serine/threonine protein kinase [Streptomyces xanthii]QNS03759.1 serine/threonine protein kinase [Streptomyces xanthii]